MHLYVHVPFCARRCSYCDFSIAVRRTVPSREFANAVLAEWAMWQRAPVVQELGDLRTLYFGGGTPSRLAPAELARLVERLTAVRALLPGAEVTLEANPEDVTAEAASAWRAAGVNRVSLGVQSFDERVLRWMHRTHDAPATGRAVDALRRAGIEEISVDLIYALPDTLARDWDADLTAALALAPQHLSLYGLTVEPATPLGRWTARDEVRPAPEERYAAEFLRAHERLGAAGFEHYEVSNYARPGFRARHNSAYWARAPFVGLGPSAHSGIRDWRRWNVPAWAAWQRTVDAGRDPVEGEERLGAEALRLESLYLGLRTADGLERELVGSAADQWIAAGWAEPAAGRLRLTAEGWLRLDALVRALA